jgi:hypothetical protein
MRNTIEGFRQDYLLKLHLTHSDAVVLRWLLSYFQSNGIEHIDVQENGKTERYYWIWYPKVIEDLPTLYITNRVVIGKMLKRICGEGQENENQFPLKKYTNWDHKKCGNKTYFRFRPNILALMEGDKMLGFDLPSPKREKKEKKESICSLSPNVEKILIELDKIHLPDNRKLFSFTLPTDHKIHTKSMKHFQDALYDLYEGRFNSRHKMEDWFLEKNNYYISDLTTKEIKDCKGNWNQIYMVLQCSAKNYSSWFDLDRETENKDWLTRDIGSFMFNPMNNSSMFYITILKKASKTREVIAENIYDKVPNTYKDYFEKFYNDEWEWDGLAYWTRIYSVHKWYRDNADDLISENNNYRYWLEDENTFAKSYYEFINMLSGTKYLKHFGTKNPTWNYFMNSKKEEHGIEE